ncbi:apolipoprotein N-acyltransferase [Mycobacterium genavense]|uniref:apolipoprotein N-acyltransferase n=1 Tax=Mycobacterium genavense TaxID=36812 RepID=UPI0004704509|nr:apolipoprotein N-acyltransferase [Mycobacterium genavense]
MADDEADRRDDAADLDDDLYDDGDDDDLDPDEAEPHPSRPGLAARLATAPARGIARLGKGAAARLPGMGAALRPRLPRLAATLGGGALLCASFPSVNWWWAAVVAAALLAWVLKHAATTLAGGFGYGFLFGLAFYAPLLLWISLLVGAVPWLALATMCALFPGIFGFFAIVVRRLPGWPLWFAALWAAQEWLKSIVPFGGFPWGAGAYGQADGPLLPLVQLGGVSLLSFGVVLLGFCVTAIALEIVDWWRTGSRTRSDVPDEDTGEEGAPPPAVVFPGVCFCLVLFAAVMVWPQVRHSGAGSGGEPTVTVAAVQGNVPRLGLGFNEQRRAVLDNHVDETLRLAEDVRAGAAPQPQFVIWPEDSSDIDPFVNADAAQRIAEAAHAINAPILIGSVLAVPGTEQGPVQYTNTAIVWNPVTGPADRHDKEIVQPFGEYLPMRWLFERLSGYAGLAGNFVPGKSTDVVQIAGVPVGVATCWEVIFDRVPRKAVLNGAQLLAVPANNATFNKRMSEQQLAFAKVRAVEHDRYVVVAGTTGISAVIAPDGAELVRTDFFRPAYLDIQARLTTKLTPATRWAPIVQWVLVAAAGAVILAGIRHNGSFPRPIRRRSRPSAADGGAALDELRPDEEAPTTVHDAAPDTAGDYTPLHQKGGRKPRYLGRHRGDK